MIVVLLLATQLRALVGAIWLGFAVAGSLGLRAALQVLTDSLVVTLGFLVVGALAIFAAGGFRRELGRAFDAACVAVLPLVLVELVVGAALGGFDLELVHPARVAVTGVAFVWTAVLVALGVVVARSRRAIARAGLPARAAPPQAARSVIDSEIPKVARRAGWAVGLVALAGIAGQGIWLVTHLDRVRPMTQGDPAPQLYLPDIGPKGEFTTAFDLSKEKGKVVVLDFWATWCNPCLKSMPHLDRLQRNHPEIAVVAINIDDPADARALFDERQYSMQLVFGDQEAQNKYGVSAIPHTVVIDRSGVVRYVFRGGGADLEAAVIPLLK